MSYRLNRRLPFPAKVVAGCVGKQRHKSKGAAEAAIRSITKREIEPLEQLRQLNAYFCVRCHSWHVGHAGHRIN